MNIIEVVGLPSGQIPLGTNSHAIHSVHFYEMTMLDETTAYGSIRHVDHSVCEYVTIMKERNFLLVHYHDGRGQSHGAETIETTESIQDFLKTEEELPDEERIVVKWR